MKKLLILAGAVLALASCTQERPRQTPNPNYLDGVYLVDLHSYEYRGFEGEDTTEFDDLCIMEFADSVLITYSPNYEEAYIPTLGSRWEASSRFSVKYVEGGVRIATQWDLDAGYEGEFWSTFGNKGMVRVEDWFPQGYAVYLQHTLNFEKL